MLKSTAVILGLTFLSFVSAQDNSTIPPSSNYPETTTANYTDYYQEPQPTQTNFTQLNTTDVQIFVEDQLTQLGNTAQNTLNEIQIAKANYTQTVNDILLRADYDIQMNFANIVQPVAQKYADLLQTLQFNQACNSTCITSDCFDRSNWVMNWGCVQNLCACNVVDPNATH